MSLILANIDGACALYNPDDKHAVLLEQDGSAVEYRGTIGGPFVRATPLDDVVEVIEGIPHLTVNIE